jgi:hypothetical protein
MGFKKVSNLVIFCLDKLICQLSGPLPVGSEPACEVVLDWREVCEGL